MTLHTFIPSTVISSSDHNADHQGLADGSNDTDSNSLQKTRLEMLPNAVYSGLTIPTSASLTSTIAAGIAYVNGKRLAPSAVAKVFTASKDTYVDLKDDGTFAYVEVANGATTGMTLTANSIRIAKVVTSGVAVTSVAQFPKMSGVSVVGDWWGGFDPLGAKIYPRPADRAVGRVARNGASSTGAPGGTSVGYNGCSAIPCRLEANTDYIFSFFEPVINAWTGSGDFIIEIYLGTTLGAYTTRVNEYTTPLGTANRGVNFSVPFNSGSYSGVVYVGIKLRSNGWGGTLNMNSDTTRTGIFAVERA